MLIKFQHHEMTLSGTGENLGSALATAGIPIDLRCSGKGTCNRCKVNLLKGKFSVDGEEIDVQDSPAIVKSCQTVVLSEDSIIEIPRTSLAGNKS